MGKFRLVITGDLGFEMWQDIPGWEKYYQGSTYGRIRSKERFVHYKDGRARAFPSTILKQSCLKNGYLAVSLCVNNEDKKEYVHRLIALTFLPKPRVEQIEVNHKSEVKTENNVENLEWCTPTYNNNYGTLKKRVSKTLTNHPLFSKAVIQKNPEGKIISEYPSISEAERATGIDGSTISKCCRGALKQSGGYIWKYA